MNNNEFKNLNFSLLGKDSELEGDFKFSGDTLINCKMKGKINIIGKGKLTFERGSSFEGHIFCQDIEVFGNIKGTVDAAGTMSIRSSAQVSGTINAKNLSIFPGASINMEGHTSIEEPSPKDAQTAH